MRGLNEIQPKNRFFPQLAAGLLFVAVFWSASWLHVGFAGTYSFFPLWFGFIITLDALNGLLFFASLMARRLRYFALLFPVSSLFWWIFEGFNEITHNWLYLSDTPLYSPPGILIASLSFSTVVPAILVVSTFWQNLLAKWPSFGQIKPLALGARFTLCLLALSGFSFALLLYLPDISYPLIWLIVLWTIEPVIYRYSQSFLRDLNHGTIRRMVVYGLAGVTCGFFWEMWNYFAYPKWIYHTPGFDTTLHIFEMPVPGYAGYIPFGWETFAVLALLTIVMPDPEKFRRFWTEN